jgi:4'-phosphopantetheinyl transferase
MLHACTSVAPVMDAVELSPGAPPDRPPPEGDVHVRLIDLRQAAPARMHLRCFLSSDEIARADRFHLETTRTRYVLTRGWLRVILARCLDAMPEQIAFSYGANGKPALGGSYAERGVEFNVSHSGDYALIALSTRGAIGADIEQLRPMPELENMASQYFSAPETRAIMAFPEADRLRAFFCCWTRKEAFMKATGEGTGIALDSFSVSLENDRATSISLRGEWTVQTLSLVPECEAAVAVAGPAHKIAAWRDAVSV